MTIRKLLESLDQIADDSDSYDADGTPEMLQAFRELGLDEHQWDVFKLVWNYRQREIDQLSKGKEVFTFG